MLVDCFTFFNELDLLELRLNELNNTVDRFVLVEATKTFQFKDKPLYFELHKQRFEKFLPKIKHIIVDNYPDNPSGSAWIYEYHQRDSIMRGLTDLGDQDLVMISDLDEIPKISTVQKARQQSGIRIFRQDAFYYFLNCINDSEQGSERYRWNGTMMLDYQTLKKHSPQFYREMSMQMLGVFRPEFLYRNYYKWQKFKKFTIRGLKIRFVEDGGWHFSYLGGVEAIIKKIESFAHSEYNKPEFKDPEKIRQLITSGEDIFGRGFKYKFLTIDQSFPDYLTKNKTQFSKFIFEP